MFLDAAPRTVETALRWLKMLAQPAETSNRFLLWIDSVGGFLVCLNSPVVLGQAVPGSGVDVPLLADLSREHARLRRDAGGYVVEQIKDVRLGGHAITEPRFLADGAQLELGRGLQMRFRQPHPLSASARLEFASRHHTQPSANAVLLMAETCVLGPAPRCHVVCPKWPGEVVLYRQQGGLFCRTSGNVEIDGQSCPGGGKLTLSSRVMRQRNQCRYNAAIRICKCIGISTCKTTVR